MITIDGPNDQRILTIRVTGKVEKDHLESIRPKVDELREIGQPFLLLQHLEGQFGISPSALWEDLKMAPGFVKLVERSALVCDSSAIRTASNIFGMLVPFPVQSFEDEAAAVTWLEKADDVTGVDIQMTVKDGVACIEAVPSDTFSIAGERHLESILDEAASEAERFRLVIRPHDFHGWEGLSAFWYHLKLMHRHSHRFERVAMVAEKRWQRVLFRLGNKLFSAQTRQFEPGQEDQARAWAFTDEAKVEPS